MQALFGEWLCGPGVQEKSRGIQGIPQHGTPFELGHVQSLSHVGTGWIGSTSVPTLHCLAAPTFIVMIVVAPITLEVVAVIVGGLQGILVVDVASLVTAG